MTNETEIHKDVIQNLSSEINSLKDTLETRRKVYTRWLLAGVVVIVLAVTAVLLPQAKNNTYPWMLISIAALIPSLILFQILNWRYRKDGKAIFVEGIARATNLEYTRDGVFPLSDTERHKIIPSYDDYSIEDGFHGQYKGTPLALQEVVLNNLERDPNNRERNRELTVFWGLLVRLKLHKPLEAHTVVIPRNAFQVFFRTQFSNFQRIKLVSNKFEKKYNVMGSDQVEGRVILNPAFMERFMSAGKIMNSKWMEVSFRHDEILFAIQQGRPLFEIGYLWRPVTVKDLKKRAEGLESILRIIDVLKLNPQVGI